MAAEVAAVEVNEVVATETVKPTHKLERKWAFWYDNQSNSKQGAAWGSTLKKAYTFDTVEEFWCLYEQIFKPSNLITNADFHLFKAEIEPKWEDPECAKGGKWTVAASGKTDLDKMWLETLMALIGEQFDEAEEICGVVASVRQRGDKLSLWTKNAANEAVQFKWVGGLESDLCVRIWGIDLQTRGMILNLGLWDCNRICMFLDPDWVAKILAIPLSCWDFEDSIYWTESVSGSYNVKKGYSIAFNLSWNAHATIKDLSRVGTDLKMFIRKKLWHLPGPKSWIILLWKILTNSLAVGEGFIRRGFEGDFNCHLCDSQTVESCDHLFRDCVFANKVWAGSVLGIHAHIGKELSIQTWIKNWLSLIQKLADWESLALSFLCTLWTIWGCRCKKIFQEKPITPYGVMKVYENSYSLVLEAEKVRSGRLNPQGVLFDQPIDNELTDLRNSISFPFISAKDYCDQLDLFVDASWRQ
ncbi:hypothetical protein KSS87_006530 [Heliosperma pusillum]|nr:hypothetical protein KSS87_006530 [Heliosperma pusillum]